ncbi:MAG: excisionase family DNA-binding protein [Pseudonocardia sp.]
MILGGERAAVVTIRGSMRIYAQMLQVAAAEETVKGHIVLAPARRMRSRQCSVLLQTVGRAHPESGRPNLGRPDLGPDAQPGPQHERQPMSTTTSPIATQIDRPPRLLLSVETAAELLSISRTRMFALIKTGEIHSIRVGRLRRIPADSLTEYVVHLSRVQSGRGRFVEKA